MDLKCFLLPFNVLIQITCLMPCTMCACAVATNHFNNKIHFISKLIKYRERHLRNCVCVCFCWKQNCKKKKRPNLADESALHTSCTPEHVSKVNFSFCDFIWCAFRGLMHTNLCMCDGIPKIILDQQNHHSDEFIR